MNAEGSHESLPGLHRLRAAIAAGRLIDAQGTKPASLTTSFGAHASGGIFQIDDLQAGEVLLFRAQVVEETGGLVHPCQPLIEILELPELKACQALLARLIERESPLWLSAATAEGRVIDALIPDEEAGVLDSLFDPDEREAFLLALGKRFSDLDLEGLGAFVEDFLVERFAEQLQVLGHPQLAAQVERLSLISDQLGYDIRAPRTSGEHRRVEAKGTRGTGSTVTFFLSRNEAEASQRIEDWSLTLCRVRGEAAEVVGWMTGAELEPYLPIDRAPNARWEKVRITVPESEFTPGLPHA